MEKSLRKSTLASNVGTTYFLLSLFSPSHLSFTSILLIFTQHNSKKRTHRQPMKRPRYFFSWSRSFWQQILYRWEVQVLYIHTSQDKSLDAGTIPWQRRQLCDKQLAELCGLLLEGGRKMNRRAPWEAHFLSPVSFPLGSRSGIVMKEKNQAPAPLDFTASPGQHFKNFTSFFLETTTAPQDCMPPQSCS